MSTYYFPIIQSKVINKNYLFPSVLCPFIIIFFSFFCRSWLRANCKQVIDPKWRSSNNVNLAMLHWTLRLRPYRSISNSSHSGRRRLDDSTSLYFSLSFPFLIPNYLNLIYVTILTHQRAQLITGTTQVVRHSPNFTESKL